MSYEGIARNPVIVVHGFLGAKLEHVKTGKSVWGSFSGIEAIESLSDEGILDFCHPMARGKALKDLTSDIVPEGLLERVKFQVLGLPFHLDVYDKLIDILRNAGYVEEGKHLPKGKHFCSLFAFYYDWRRDIPENAARLHDFILLKKAYLREAYEKLYGVKDFDVQFDVLAHSMGGLLSRYYLRYGAAELPEDGSLPKLDWEGSKHIDKMLVVGTPNAGYLDACMELVDGLQAAKGSHVHHPALVGTFPAYYQMMPLVNFRPVVYADDPEGLPVDIFDPKVWIDMKWGLADPGQDNVLKAMLPGVSTKAERREIALDHLEKCLKRARQFTEAMRVKAEHPNDVAMFLFLGDAVKTARTAAADRETGKLKVIKYESGDGKVLASSARFDERESGEWVPFLVSPIRWDSVTNLKAAHMGITASDDFASNATYALLAFPTKKQEKTMRFYEGLVGAAKSSEK